MTQRSADMKVSSHSYRCVKNWHDEYHNFLKASCRLRPSEYSIFHFLGFVKPGFHITVGAEQLPAVAFYHLPSFRTRQFFSNRSVFLWFPRHVFEVPFDSRNSREKVELVQVFSASAVTVAVQLCNGSSNRWQKATLRHITYGNQALVQSRKGSETLGLWNFQFCIVISLLLTDGFWHG